MDTDNIIKIAHHPMFNVKDKESMSNDGANTSFVFAPEAPVDEHQVKDVLKPWNILIVDDEPSIHQITEIALSHFEFASRPLHFLHAYSGEQACQIVANHNDIALVLLDVVMETDDAGLKTVNYIRNELSNNNVRVILRTGQPGQAPEMEVIEKYDINGYNEKTELTANKLHSILYTALRSYRDIVALDKHRKGLEKVIDATASILEKSSIQGFAQGALEQLAAILYVDNDLVLMEYDAVMATRDSSRVNVLASVKSGNQNPNIEDENDLITELTSITEYHQGSELFTENNRIVFTNSYGEKRLVLAIRGNTDISPTDYFLIELFCKNVAIALENIELYDEVSTTQKDIIYSVCELAESRSKETGNHVRRVAMYSKLMAQKYGLSEAQCDELFFASPLHDVGKVAIPDSILNKPGPLTDSEWEIMKTHAEVGFNTLNHLKKPIFQAGAILAGQHHENWDGSGYPTGLKGNDIHIYGRITAVADVFDALMSKRCYKPAWDQATVNSFIVEQSGIKFDPELVKLFIENYEEFVSIYEQYKDPE